VASLVAGHMRFIHIKDMREAKRRRFVRDPLFPLDLELHRLDCVGSHGKLDGYDLALALYREEMAKPPLLRPLLTGDDLIAAGYPPGPRMGAMLRAVEDARLEHRVSTSEEALAWVSLQFPRGGGS
jgi:poly(A) polymerase